jgi:hypothetical protein
MRRLILLISVGWLPPYLRPSGACLTRGTRMPAGSRHAGEGDTTPGLRLFPCTLETSPLKTFATMGAITVVNGL